MLEPVGQQPHAARPLAINRSIAIATDRQITTASIWVSCLSLRPTPSTGMHYHAQSYIRMYVLTYIRPPPPTYDTYDGGSICGTAQ